MNLLKYQCKLRERKFKICLRLSLSKSKIKLYTILTRIYIVIRILIMSLKIINNLGPRTGTSVGKMLYPKSQKVMRIVSLLPILMLLIDSLFIFIALYSIAFSYVARIFYFTALYSILFYFILLNCFLSEI